ncbi:MAG: hypothetical protein B6I37_00805 [Desulfobacteraceae bacterium 4572_35.2]|nr:MAG: hypothetical protein B6I37_00805 [Desulfobacteraceae bacterium 4572_35.2]
MTLLKQSMAIQGIGCVGGFGSGNDQFVSALKAGHTSATTVELNHPAGQQTLPALLANTDRLTDFVSRRSLRRIDHFSRMALLGGYLAIEDAGLAVEDCGRIGIIVASGYGATNTTFNFLGSIIDDGDSCASPTSFSNSVHNVAAAYLSMQLQALGPNLTISQFDLSINAALHNAACWLAQRRVDTVLVGGVDEHSSLLNYCYQRYFANSDAVEQIDPFDFARQSAVVGEGAAFLVLSRHADKAKYGFIAGLDAGDFSQRSTVEDSDLLLIGADGHQTCGAMYEQLPTAQSLLNCTPCYGSLPVGQAFDLAAAGLMLREQSCYGVARQQPVGCSAQSSFDSIASLKCTANDQFSLIRLSRRGGDDA